MQYRKLGKSDISVAADLELSAETIAALTEATEEAKRVIGPNPDMWQSESRFR